MLATRGLPAVPIRPHSRGRDVDGQAGAGPGCARRGRAVHDARRNWPSRCRGRAAIRRAGGAGRARDWPKARGRRCRPTSIRPTTQVLVVVVIEEAAAVERCEEIAAIDGVDVLFVGTSDLSFSMGYRGNMLHPDVIKAAERVRDAALRHGKHVRAAGGVARVAAAVRRRGLPAFPRGVGPHAVCRGRQGLARPARPGDRGAACGVLIVETGAGSRAPGTRASTGAALDGRVVDVAARLSPSTTAADSCGPGSASLRARHGGCARQEGPWPSREVRVIVHAAPGGHVRHGRAVHLARPERAAAACPCCARTASARWARLPSPRSSTPRRTGTSSVTHPSNSRWCRTCGTSISRQATSTCWRDIIVRRRRWRCRRRRRTGRCATSSTRFAAAPASPWARPGPLSVWHLGTLALESAHRPPLRIRAVPGLRAGDHGPARRARRRGHGRRA